MSIAAGALFVLPSAFLLWGMSWVYAAWGHVPWIAAVFHGLKPAVTAIVAAAVIRIGRRALRGGLMWAVAAAAFGAIFFLQVPFPMIVAGAAAFGLVGGWIRPAAFGPGAPTPVRREKTTADDTPGSARSALEEADTGAVIDDSHAAPPHTRPSWARALKVLGVSLALWGAPVVIAGFWQGWDGTLVREGVFFSKAATVTFGGAYAVLPYVGQQAVVHYGWLTAPQMLDGLGLAETTPGPLIMVVQFVGFLGAWHQPGALGPLVAATLGAMITIWVTFVPCFLWIFLGAPHIEQLRGNVHLGGTLTTVTASVVGVVLNLAVWFGLQVFFPAAGPIDYFTIAVSVAAFAAIQLFRIGVIPVIVASGLLGLAWSWI